jgi:hypothetical protein
VKSSIFTNVVEALLTRTPSGTSLELGGNYITNINMSFTTPNQGTSGPHPNCLETLQGGTFYIHDNFINEAYVCEGGQVGNPGETDYVWNNIWVMSGGSGSNGPQVPQSSPSGSLYFWNNTLYNTYACINQAGHGGTYTGDFEVNNNHCITSSSAAVVGEFSASGTNSTTNNVVMTPAVATSQGYTSAETYVYSPTAGTNSTVGAGMNLTSAWPSGYSSNDTGYACTEQTIGGVLQAVCPVRTATNGRTSSWDAGAYQWGGSSLPLAPTGLSAVVQ